MNKMFAVLKREYLQAVRRKSFIIMTLIFPFLMIAAMLVPALMMAKGMGQKRIAVLDGTGKLREAFSKPNERPQTDAKEEARKAVTRRGGAEVPTELKIEYVDQSGADVDSAATPYFARLARDDDRKLDGVLTIPAKALQSADEEMTYYSRSATDFITQERLGRLANRSIQRLRLSASGIDPADIEQLTRDVPVQATQLSKSGEKKSGGELNFLLAFLFGVMLLMPSLVYGNETMRGIVQEKSDRVVEVLVSSVTPMQLLTGKIVGVAAVGFTQIFVWMTMAGLAAGFGAAVMKEAKVPVNFAQFFRPSVVVYFIIFFILAYLTYVCVYAIAGAVSNSEREAQQFMMPMMLVMMIPWFLMMPIITNPDAQFAVGFSIAPVFGPMTMFVRTLVTEPPMWHVALSIALSAITIVALFWMTGKIFRVGILSYGKRPTLPELWRWLKAA